MEKGDIIQFQANWGQEPTNLNTALVVRVAKDGSWADVKSIYGSKRIKNFNGVRKITEPITIFI